MDRYKLSSEDSVPAALKFWVLFILVFRFLAGFNAATSILLGALAAIGVGIIAAYWTALKQEGTTGTTAPPRLESPFRLPSRLTDRFPRSIAPKSAARSRGAKPSRRGPTRL